MIGATPATDQQTNSLPGIYSASSKAWIQRQKKDPFVKKSREEGFASRASFKILQILEKETFMKEIHSGETPFRIIDLGAAPGSWSQALSRHFNTLGSKFEIIALDKQDLSIPPPHGVKFLKGDFTESTTQKQLEKILQSQTVDLLVSDMAPAASGDKQLDHDRLVNLSEEAFHFAMKHLKQGGTFVSKLSHGSHGKHQRATNLGLGSDFRVQKTNFVRLYGLISEL